MDSFLEGFEDCHAKVLWKYLEIDLSDVPLIDAPSMLPTVDSPPAGEAGALIALPGEDNIVEF